MAGGSIDQALADRLVESIRHRFRYVPAARLWLEYREGVYRADRARENLRDAYLTSLAEIASNATRDEKFARQVGSAANNQSWMYWLLEHDSRVTATPDEFEFPGPYRLRQEPRLGNLEDRPGWAELGEALPTLRGEWLRNWLAPDSRPRAGASRNLLLRVSRAIPDLETALPALAEMLGGAAIARLAPSIWTHPDRFKAEHAMSVAGAHMLVLEGQEKTKKPPQTAALRWAHQERMSFLGRDGGLYSIRVPPCLVMTGPAWSFGSLDLGLRSHVLSLEG